MNPHILFVIDHLANTGKYTQEELDANFEAANHECAYWAAASRAAANYAAWASAATYRAADSYWADYWVDEYFKITGEDKQAYIDKLKGES
jgi:hypothetical protein